MHTLIFTSAGLDVEQEYNLPNIEDNLFQRLIRNPHVASATPRERECTEMLCAVLKNSSTLRINILKWLAKLAALEIPNWNTLQFKIGTEGSIFGKRDDLRIEAWEETPEGRRPVFLWTIEVKVGAGFHVSGSVDASAEEETLVHQVKNYDSWLYEQQSIVPHCLGFVLALEDMQQQLPNELKCSWHCTSWSKLAVQLKIILKSLLPDTERFLAKHLLGFIQTHLWRVSEVSAFELDFNDVALIRAYNELGLNCEQKIDQLVAPLATLIENSGIGQGKVAQQKCLFNSTLRSVVYRYLFDAAQFKYPYMMAGIERGQLAIWIETVPSFAKKAAILSICRSVLPELQSRNKSWKMREEGWYDLEVRLPLEVLLGQSDQAAVFNEFFKNALTDLSAVKIVEKIAAIME